MEKKFESTSKDKILDQFLNVCGELSSLSDGCSAIVLRYFDTVYEHLQKNFNAKNVCHLSGQCSKKFHVHENDASVVNVILNFN